MDFALDQGKFWDTAELYSVPPRAEHLAYRSYYWKLVRKK